MKFPPITQFVKSLVAAIVLAVAAFVLFPLFGLEASSKQLFVMSLAVGALLGGILSAIEFRLPSGGTAGSGEKKTIFVGNLAFKATPDELAALFAPYGTVQSVRIMKDRATRRPRGFAFVEMDASGTDKAIKALDGKEFLGRNLRVNEGAERKERDEQQAA